MKKKQLTLDDIILLYREQYRETFKEKGRLSPDEKERLRYWMALHKIHKDIEGMKPLVMGGYPQFLYHVVTPYYQIISYVFIFVGILLILISSLGFFIPNLSAMVGYLIPSTLSLIFGIIILMFLRTLDVKK